MCQHDRSINSLLGFTFNDDDYQYG